MKNLEFSYIALLSICVLASCNTIVGVGRDIGDSADWATNKPSTIGKVIGDAPSGYGAHPKPVATPSEDTENTDESDAENQPPLRVARPVMRPRAISEGDHVRLVWNKISNYNAANPTLSDAESVSSAPSPRLHRPAGPPIVEYNPSVAVFPVNGDMSPYTQVNAVDGSYMGGGEMVQQVYFAHGSASISRIDHKNLHELAQSLVHNASDYKLDVVGHASKRVNGVRDPIERRMINFKIAQRRANAVANELLQAGVTPGWIVASSAGDGEPNPHRAGKSQEAADRRAEVFLSTTNTTTN